MRRRKSHRSSSRTTNRSKNYKKRLSETCATYSSDRTTRYARKSRKRTIIIRLLTGSLTLQSTDELLTCRLFLKRQSDPIIRELFLTAFSNSNNRKFVTLLRSRHSAGFGTFSTTSKNPESSNQTSSSLSQTSLYSFPN